MSDTPTTASTRILGGASSPRTAGQVAAAAVAPAVSPSVVQGGSGPALPGCEDGRQVTCSAAALGAMLRRVTPLEVDLRANHDWWTLRVPAIGCTAEGFTLAQLSAQVVTGLRAWATAHVEDATNPLVWLVGVSTDAELAGWLGLPLP